VAAGVPTYIPLGHKAQLALDILPVYVPAAHSVHEAEPSLAARVPGQQLRQVEAPVPFRLTYRPTAHKKQAESPSLSAYEPSGHGVHASARGWRANVPFAQSTQELALLEGWYLPGKQVSHWV
jgi:hypothetical protein